MARLINNLDASMSPIIVNEFSMPSAGEGPIDPKKEYLTFTALEDNCTITFKCCYESPSSYKTIEVSTDKVNWTENTSSHEGTELATLNEGESLYVRGDNSTYHNYDEDPEIDDDVFNSFFMSAGVKLSGNIMSLIQSEGFDKLSRIEEEFALGRLFSDYVGDVGNENTIDAKNLLLTATEIAESCYSNMFRGCTSLINAPELPATRLDNYCYNSMFRGCTSLTTAPELPATELANYCYNSMFQGCTSLTTAPELPATTLAEHCYSNMFSGCALLTTTPELSATELADYCYGYMFAGCTSLTTAPELPATELAEYCYQGMFYRCTSLTTAPELSATELAGFCYQNMFQECTSLTTAPGLPATELAQSCYQSMFHECTSLESLTCLAIDISATNCITDWLFNISTTGTLYVNPSMTGATWNIPQTWSVQSI